MIISKRERLDLQTKGASIEFQGWVAHWILVSPTVPVPWIGDLY